MYELDMKAAGAPSAPPRSRPSVVSNSKLAETVVASFNTWAFKREQPSDLPLLTATVSRRIAAGLPVAFVLYWGKGPRSRSAAPDLACLAFLAKLGERVAQVYPQGARFTLCQTDTHARLNGHDETVIRSYFNDITEAARPLGMSTVRLSEVVAANGGDALVEDSGSLPILDSLIACAEKWYRGPGDPVDGARRYFAMNMVERRAIEAQFGTDIFLTFNGSDYRELFPAGLPIFYMYSLKRGCAVKPWFMDESGRPMSGIAMAA